MSAAPPHACVTVEAITDVSPSKAAVDNKQSLDGKCDAPHPVTRSAPPSPVGKSVLVSAQPIAQTARSCLRSILGTSADGNPCATVMPLPLNSGQAQSPKTNLRVVCSSDASCQDQATSTSITDSRCDSLSVQASNNVARRSPSKKEAIDDPNVFLNASIQLAHLQSDTHQRVRQLWHVVQRLRWESQISDAAIDTLHKEMLALVKSASAEKLDSSKFTKTGYLKLIQAPISATAALKQQSVKALFGTSSTKPGQLVWCALSEDQARFEMSPVKDESANITTMPSAGAGGTGKSTLASSLMGMFSDAFQAVEDDSTKRTLIKLQGCHVRTMSSTKNGSGESTEETPIDTGRFQILVPHLECANRGDESPPRAPRSTSYDIYVFEAASGPHSVGDSEHDSSIGAWVRALDRVCMFHLFKLEERIHSVETAAEYREVLTRSFPLTIPLTWLRNRQDRADLHGNSAGGLPSRIHDDQISLQQKRASRNVSMVQIIKDLERDKILLDEHLMCPVDPHAQQSFGTSATLDTVSEIFKYLVAKVMASLRQPTASTNTARTAPLSPARRFMSFNEAKAVAFVERVLRGCSRTQSGGDIYDAISFLCQHHRVSICPLSQEACPVQIDTVEYAEGEAEFQVDMTVRMRFKVIELTPTIPESKLAKPEAQSRRDGAGGSLCSRPRRPSLQRRDSLREWAIIEGTLVRHFALGKASTPGSVTVTYVQREGR